MFHWLGDSYPKASWPFLGKHVIEPNMLHHFKRRIFTKTSFWRRNSGTVVICGCLMVKGGVSFPRDGEKVSVPVLWRWEGVKQGSN